MADERRKLSMPSPGKQSRSSARRVKVSRREFMLARAELAAGGLSHHDERRLRTIEHNWELASLHRHQAFRHLVITLIGVVATMVVVGAAFGIVPAIEAASGDGAAGTFVVSNQVCVRRAGCTWLGTFESPGQVVPRVMYEGVLPVSAGPGSRFPARYPGDNRAYARHGTHTWAWDVLYMVVISGAVGFLLWVSPLGMRQRRTAETV
jgi:hypothetical protein